MSPAAAVALAEAVVGGLTEAGRLVAAEREQNVRLAVAAMHSALPDLAADYRAALRQREDELAGDSGEDDGA